MSENSVKGIVLDKISLNAMNIAFMRKLKEFDCAIVMDQQGNDKNGKAQLAVLDTVTKTAMPSILLITTEKLLYSWYQIMICGIGADFKFITADPKSLNFFSPNISNFYITYCEAAENPVFEKIRESGLVWDLVIIDGGLSSGGMEIDKILESYDIRTKKLVVFAPYIKTAPGEAEKLSMLPVKFLENSSKAEYFKTNTPDETAAEFSLSTPFMRCFTSHDTVSPDIKIISYKVNDEILKAKQDQSITSLYSYGGNVFEELTLDMRKLYNCDRYDDHIVNALRGFDSKLDAYINEVSMLLEDPDTRIITYFSSEKTLEYVQKVLSTSAVGLKRIIAVKKGQLYNIDDSRRNFDGKKKADIRVILSLDDQHEQYDLIDNITHVFCFELPNSPLTLHRRFRQGGRKGFTNPQFIMFRDDKDLFDGRMLCSTLALNIAESFVYGIPGRNIYLFTEGLDNIISSMLCELEGAEEFSDEKISAIAVKYNIKNVSESTREIICRKRDAIKAAFGLPGKIVDKKAANNILAPKIQQLRQGCCFLDSNGMLLSKAYNIEGDNDYGLISRGLETEPIVLEQLRAREALKECDTADKLLALLRDVKETDKAYVFYCAWNFLNRNCGYGKDYNEFLREVFEEVV